MSAGELKLSGVILKGKKGYRHKKAQGMARSRVAAKAAKRRKFTPEMWDYAITHLRDDGWTFEQSCGRARRDGIPMVCVETLYQEYSRRQELVRRGLSKEVLPRCRGARRGGFRLAASRRPLRGRLHPSSRAGLAFGAHQAKPSAEARFAGLTENCYTTN